MFVVGTNCTYLIKLHYGYYLTTLLSDLKLCLRTGLMCRLYVWLKDVLTQWVNNTHVLTSGYGTAVSMLSRQGWDELSAGQISSRLMLLSATRPLEFTTRLVVLERLSCRATGISLHSHAFDAT